MDTLTKTETGTYGLDPSHSRVGFVARHAMITKVRGAFNELEGSGSFDAEDPTRSNLSVSIQVESVDTRNDDRDGHLRSGDFFDAEAYPTINFTSTAIAPAGDSVYRVTGDLVIKGVNRPITFDLEVTGPAIDPWGNTRLGLEGSVEVSRKEWGLTWNTPLDSGGVLVSDKVTLEFEISAVKADNA
ncbi:MAG: YceI family protein [Acidimicrobiales bacterium]|nr:YceI family protein [Acidimicrobiales bacterium]RZV46052.1 MAG: polyisoprenoid-binding protein [Acidimicrobiales bacterium]